MTTLVMAATTSILLFPSAAAQCLRMLASKAAPRTFQSHSQAAPKHDCMNNNHRMRLGLQLHSMLHLHMLSCVVRPQR
jgi:hypothetical protein